ncbi:MAG TPA: hypothetical protein VMT74_04105 [Gaiellaceae bacterium]|nr:hypothetical protein [Gaiellaceae bacterium]
MKALVVYESMYGNTAEIGEAISASLRGRGLEVEGGLVSAIDPSRAGGVDVLVVGGPTHIHGMSSAKSRRTAANDEKNAFPEPTVEPGLRDWIKRLPPGGDRPAAAFDTRFDKSVVFTGSAAKGIARRLEGRGFRLVLEPECFLVSTQNRLLERETEHAAAWAERLADDLAAREAR